MKSIATLVLIMALCVLMLSIHGSSSPSGYRSGEASSSSSVGQDPKLPNTDFEYVAGFRDVVVNTKYLCVHANVPLRLFNKGFSRVFEFTFSHTENYGYNPHYPRLVFTFDQPFQGGARSKQMVIALEAFDGQGQKMPNAQKRFVGFRPHIEGELIHGIDIPYNVQWHQGLSTVTNLKYYGRQADNVEQEVKGTVIKLLPATPAAPKVIKLYLGNKDAQHLSRIYFDLKDQKILLYSDYNLDCTLPANRIVIAPEYPE